MREKSIRSVGTCVGYDLWSENYDQEDNSVVALDREILSQMIGDVRGLRVVDLGCGTGQYLVRLAQSGAFVTGLDFSLGMLAQARAKLHENPEALLLRADLSEPLPLRDNCADLVISSLVLEHIRNLEQFFKEAARICRPGGRALMSNMHPALFLRDIQAHFVDDQTGSEIRFQSYPHQVSSFVMAALRAGFRISSLEEIVVGDDAGDISPKLEKFRGWPVLLIMDLEVR